MTPTISGAPRRPQPLSIPTASDQQDAAPSSRTTIYPAPRQTDSALPARSWSTTVIAANIVGCVLLLCSATVAVTYAIARTDDLPTQVVGATVAAAVATALSLSITSLAMSVRLRDVGHFAVSLLAVVIFGTFALTATLGSLDGKRADAHQNANDGAAGRARTSAAFTRASDELAALGLGRGVADVSAELASIRRPRSCPKWSTEADRALCVRIAGLEGEQARAQQRVDLQTRLDKLAEELKGGPAKSANSDAAAIVQIAAVAGYKLGVDNVNLALSILNVLVLEVGPGLAFAVGAASGGGRPERHPVPVAPVSPASAVALSGSAAVAASVPSPQVALIAGPKTPIDTPASKVVGLAENPGEQASVQSGRSGEAGGKVVSFLEARGGRVAASQRTLAADLDMPKTTLVEALNELVGSGRVTVAAGTRGTVVELVRRPVLTSLTA